MHRNVSVLVVIRGIPGSGKSYLASALNAKLQQRGVVVLDPDAIDFSSQEYATHVQTLTQEGVDEKLHAYRFLRGQAYRAIEHGNIIIWNQAFRNLDIFNKMVDRLQTHAQESNTVFKVLIVEVETDSALAKERIAQRAQSGGHNVTDELFAQFVQDHKSFANAGYVTVTVRGDDDIEQSTTTVLDAISRSEQ